MANPEHVALVRKGAEAIAEWRRAHPKERLDLSGANLSGADLSGANLSDANLRDANLSEADLSGADLNWADLIGASLSGASLSGANLRDANLSDANLSGADLSWADFSDANLIGADFSGADLNWADLIGANLIRANLTGADLRDANLSDANLSEAFFADTSLGNTYLSKTRGLETARHFAPSSIGVDTLIASVRGAGGKLTPELVIFFRGAGVPEELLKELPRIVAEVKYYSCFISYGQPDLEFAKKLCQDLEDRGVPCWLYDMDMTVGSRTWHEIERMLDKHDRMVVLCSEAALGRQAVKKEIDKQIDKNPDKLVPVSLDNRWTEDAVDPKWAGRDLKTWLLDRNYADFANKPYEEALDALLKGLRRPAVKKARRKKG